MIEWIFVLMIENDYEQNATVKEIVMPSYEECVKATESIKVLRSYRGIITYCEPRNGKDIK